MPIPTSVLTAVAPMLIDKFADRVLGGASSTPGITVTDTATQAEQVKSYVRDLGRNGASATTPPPPIPDPVIGMVREYFDHQKKKASVRPAIMRGMGNMTLLKMAVSAGLAITHAFVPHIVTAEALETAVAVLMLGAAGTGGTYLYGHTTRSIEKAKGSE